MKATLTCITLFLSLLLTSCDPEPSVDVNQDRIKTDYSITYSEGSNETSASASFWFGSTPLKITSPAEVLANDKTMKKQDILGIISYVKTFDKKTSVIFSYTDHDARTFTNQLLIADYIGTPTNLTSISASEDLVVEWDGNEIAPDETVTIEIQSQEAADAYWSASKGSNGSTSFLIDANTLGPEFIGEAKLKFSRQHTTEVTDAPRGGEVTTTYISKGLKIQIEP